MFALPCDWSKIHYLITDRGITPAQIAAFEALGVQVLVAGIEEAKKRAVF